MTDTQAEPQHELEEFRAAKDDMMRGEYSPLLPEQRTTFAGLNYYPYNEDLRLELTLDTDVAHEPVIMETSTGGEQEYHRIGKVHFQIDGQDAQLTIFESDGQLFVPLRDVTSTSETYPAGRYLEPEPLGDANVLVDFNYLYNPYCAYNEQWSCPIPPVENWLRVPLRAGEKRYHDGSSDG